MSFVGIVGRDQPLEYDDAEGQGTPNGAIQEGIFIFFQSMIQSRFEFKLNFHGFVLLFTFEIELSKLHFLFFENRNRCYPRASAFVAALWFPR